MTTTTDRFPQTDRFAHLRTDQFGNAFADIVTGILAQARLEMERVLRLKDEISDHAMTNGAEPTDQAATNDMPEDPFQPLPPPSKERYRVTIACDQCGTMTAFSVVGIEMSGLPIYSARCCT